jgi:Putative lumazine-binding
MQRLHRVCVVAVSAIVALVLCPPPVAAQASASESVAQMAVVNELFDAMRAGDSARVRAVFHPQLVSTVTSDVGRDGVARVRMTSVDGFVKAMGTPHAEVYDERLFNPRVLIDGTLASVWVDYSFYLGTTFSHCGVDIFQLAKVGESWKIVALSDTRRTTGCTR